MAKKQTRLAALQEEARACRLYVGEHTLTNNSKHATADVV